MTGRFELDTGEFILIISQGGTDEQDNHFLAVLKEAWQRVPVAARKLIPFVAVNFDMSSSSFCGFCASGSPAPFTGSSSTSR